MFEHTAVQHSQGGSHHQVSPQISVWLSVVPCPDTRWGEMGWVLRGEMGQNCNSKENIFIIVKTCIITNNLTGLFKGQKTES